MDGHVGLLGEEQEREIRVGPSDLFGKPDAGLGVERAVHRKLDVGDDTEHEFPVPLVVVPGLLKSRAEQNLRPGTHAQELVCQVDPFADEALRLLEDLRINEGEKRRVVPHIVFDHDDRLDVDNVGIMLDVQLVFERLDDGDDDAEVPLPDKHPVEDRRVARDEQLAQLPVVVGEENDGDLKPCFLHPAGELDGVHVVDMECGDDQIEAAFLQGKSDCIASAGHPGEFRGVAEVEALVFVADELVQAAVFFE